MPVNLNEIALLALFDDSNLVAGEDGTLSQESRDRMQAIASLASDPEALKNAIGDVPDDEPTEKAHDPNFAEHEHESLKSTTSGGAPLPSKNESKEDFISRCMGADDLQGKNQSQRAGMCYGLWREQHPHTTDTTQKSATCSSCGPTCGCSSCKTHKHKPRTVAYSYKFGGPNGDLLGLVETSGNAPEINDDEMSAACVLASSNRDRQGDIIETDGVDLNEHRANPIVMFDHGKTYPFMIGKTESPDGEYTVQNLPDYQIITQKTYFDEENPVPRQVYSLIRRRFLRANSIAVKDWVVEPLPPDPAMGLPGRKDGNGKVVPYKHIKTSSLAEVTWTPLPANPDAVASLLGRGRIDTNGFDNEALDPLIYKSLAPFVPARKTWPTTITRKSMGANMAAITKKAEEEHGEQVAQGEPSGYTKPSAQAGHDVHEGLTGMKAMLDHHLSRVEHPETVDHLNKMKEAMMTHCSENAAHHNKNFPEDPINEEDEESGMKEDSGTGGSHVPSGQTTVEQPKSATTSSAITRRSYDPEEANRRLLAREKAALAAALEAIGAD